MWLVLAACTPPAPLPPVEVGTLGADFEARRRDVTWVDRPALAALNGAWQARSGALRALFLPDTTWLVDRRDREPDWAVGLTAARYGRPRALVDLAGGVVATDGTWLERRRDGLVEWFDNRPDGLEHGFTVAAPPPGDGPLVVDLEVAGATPHAVGAYGAMLRTGPGAGVRWSGLAAWDADRRPLEASLAVAGSTVRLTVDDAGARFPVVIDPVLTLHERTIAVSNPVSIDSSSDLLVVGSPPLTATPGGSAIVYERNATGDTAWGSVADLTISGALQVGVAVAIDGALVAVGSAQSNDVALYRNHGPGFVQEAVIDGNGGNAGAALDLGSETVLVGAPIDGSPSLSGVSYLVNRYASGVGSWNTSPAPFEANTPVQDGLFGSAVQMSGAWLVVGAPGSDDAYVLQVVDGAPVQRKIVAGATGSELGAAVAIDGNRVAIGAPGSDEVYVYHRDGSTAWSRDAIVAAPLAAGPGFGRAVALHADTLAVTDHPGAGAAARVHLFERRDGAWGYVESVWGGLLGSDETPLALTVNDALLAVAAPEDSAVLVYRREGDRFVEEAASGAAGVASEFGTAVAVSGRLVAVGAPGDDPAGWQDGSVALYVREDRGDWTFVGDVAGDPGGAGRMGEAVAADGDLVVAGAPADPRMGPSAGATYVLSYDGASFELDTTLFPDIGLGADLTSLAFGSAVAVHQLFVVSGAPGRGSNAGSGFVHWRIPVFGWVDLVEVGAGSTNTDKMGNAVAVSDGMFFVGSHRADRPDGTTVDSGAVEVWELTTLSSAGLVQRIDGDYAGDGLGRAIDVEGQWMAIGMPFRDLVDPDVGAVDLWQLETDETSPDRWRHVTEVVRGSFGAPSGVANDRYGFSVALAGDRLYVGSENAASVEERRRNVGGIDVWDLTATLTGSTGYGHSVAAGADTVVVGEAAAGLDGAAHFLQIDAEHDPVGLDDAYVTPEETPLVVGSPTVLANDHDPDGDPLDATMIVGIQCSPQPPCGSVTAFGADGTFTYTPPADWNGGVRFSYEIDDGTTVVGPIVVDVTVSPVNDAPVASPDGGYLVPSDNPVVFTTSVLANDSDIDADMLTAVLVSQPAVGGAVTLSPNGQFTFDPDGTTPVDTSFQYQACDPGGLCSSSVVVAVTINFGNRPPSPPLDQQEALNEDEAYAEGPGSLLAGVIDEDGDPVTIVVTTEPTKGTLQVGADGSWSYQPFADLNGADFFEFDVSDDNGQTTSGDPARVTLDIQPVNDPPTGPLALAYTSLVEDQLYAVGAPGLLSSMSDVDLDALEAALVTDPEHGALGLSIDGSFTYTPDPDWNGTDRFVFQVKDQETGIYVGVDLTVGPVNDAPTAPLEIVVSGLTEDVAYAEIAPGLLSAAADVDGDTLSVVLLTEPSRGTLRVEPTGAWAYTPDADTSGLDTFRFEVHDGDDDLTLPIVDVRLDVAAVNDRPIAAGDGPFELPEDGVLTLDPADLVANDTDVEDPSGLLEVQVTADPVHGTLVEIGGDLVYTPDPDYAGSDAFSYRAVDLDNATSLAAVDVLLEVAPANDAPRAVDDDLGQASGPVQADLLANDTDAEGDAMTAELVSEPHLADAVLAPDGSLTYTPRPGLVGRDTFVYVAIDANGAASAPAEVEVVLVPPGTTTTGPTTGPDDTGCVELAWYHDADGDGFGADATEVDACTAPFHHVAEGGDCDDGLPASYPGAPEIVGDGVDQDCDGLDNTVVPLGACTGCGGASPSNALAALGLAALLRRRRASVLSASA